MGKRFTSAQKGKIIDLHLHGGYSTRRLSSEFGISRSSIQNWLRTYRAETGETPLANNINKAAIKPGNASKIMMLEEIKMQIEVLETFQKELERWDVPE